MKRFAGVTLAVAASTPLPEAAEAARSPQGGGVVAKAACLHASGG
jgi:proline racemase